HGGLGALGDQAGCREDSEEQEFSECSGHQRVYLEPYAKSSNNVTLSALVQTPTMPASLNFSSSHSMAFVPSRVTVKCLPWNSTRKVCHWFDATFMPVRFLSLRRPFTVS